MGASSSTGSSNNNAKSRRKISMASAESGADPEQRANRLLMQNCQLDSAGEWHKKAHSMYELQRERSTETANANGVNSEEKQQQHGETGNSKKKKKASSSDKQQQKATKMEKAVSPGPSSSPPDKDSSVCQQPANRLTQRRNRPLTWAWLRGHELNLPPPSSAAEEPVKKAAHNSVRRRSLKAGHENLVNTSSAGDATNTSPFHRQLSACAPSASSSQQSAGSHAPLSRRASQGTALGHQMNRQKSVRKSDAGFSNPISANGREIIQFCFDNPHNEIGVRICTRLLEKRPDFRNFAYSMGKERWLQMTHRLREFLEDVVRKVDNIECVERIARKYGEQHVELKCFGFKPDFWVSLADAITVECVILDQATHQPSDTITAWSMLVSVMFSAVRDGYYQAMRQQRISQRHKNVQQREQQQQQAVQQQSEEEQQHKRQQLLGPQQLGLGRVEKSASANELKSPTNKGLGKSAVAMGKHFEEVLDEESDDKKESCPSASPSPT